MTSFTPTLEQQAVIEATDARFVVTAAAGAGKTGTLVDRYVRLVELGLRPDQLLTITFTRKAAAEMKERIVEKLLKRGLTDEAQIAETGPIQTIHSFCERLLRENSVLAGLDPGFEVLSESQTTHLIESCVRRAIAEPITESDFSEQLIALLAGSSVRDSISTHGLLESAVRMTLGQLRQSGFDFDQIQSMYANPASILFHWERALVDSLPAEVAEAFRQAPNDKSFPERLRDAYKQVAVRVPKWLAAKSDAKYDAEAANHVCGLMEIALAAWAAVERDMELRQTLDFTALERRAVRLLKDSPEAVSRLRAQYKVVMVDEAQDVNPIQYQLLASLCAEQEMLVGDSQQSIYGFRQADVELFRTRASEGSARRLSRNHRSGPGILAFVDSYFGSLWGEQYVAMSTPEPVDFDSNNSTWDGVEFWLQKERDEFGIAKYVRDLADEGLNLGKVCILVRGLPYGINLQKALSDSGVQSRISGGSERFYTRLEIRDVANTLLALTDPHNDYALLASLRSPFCGLSIDTIAKLALNKPVIDALAGVEPPVPEDAAKIAGFIDWFLPLSRYADRLPAWEVIAELYAVSGYLEALARKQRSDQLLANARKLLTLATKEPEQGPAEYAERIREIQQFKHKEGDAPAEDEDQGIVTIMTIHKAKGLEFEIVIVPDTHGLPEKGSREVEIDPRLGTVVTKFGKGASLFHSWTAERRKEREAEEEQRVLYVALTRAKQRLCIAAHPRTKAANCVARKIALHAGLERSAPEGALIRGSLESE